MMTLAEIKNILSDRNPKSTEELAQESARLTRQYFGRTMSLYAPLYLSNYCSSHCTYCGYHSHNKIKRVKLTPDEMHLEMKHVAATGIENILLLTGESYQATPTSYLKEAVDVAKQYFTSIALEVHPMDTPEYAELFGHGVDGITVYQETYDRKRYKEVHISGKKSDYDFRYATPERAAQGGMRQISMGILLGLSQTAEDLFALYNHVSYMEKNYPGVEYSLSFPRLRTIKGREFATGDVEPDNSTSEIGRNPEQGSQAEAGDLRGINDITFIKIICLTRILFPRVGINLSTREEANLRDHALELGVTKISAGSNTAVGGYVLKATEDQDPQFDIEDTRSVAETIAMLKANNFDPVFTDWRPIGNDK